jgi:hypothetical protein
MRLLDRIETKTRDPHERQNHLKKLNEARKILCNEKKRGFNFNNNSEWGGDSEHELERILEDDGTHSDYGPVDRAEPKKLAKHLNLTARKNNLKLRQ